MNPDYKKSSDYIYSLFIPSIVVGLAVEYIQAIENQSQAKDGIIKNMVLTPFLDFKISPLSQFRVGIPVKYYEGTKKEVAFGPFCSMVSHN
ncbi:MAG: hypothetical protein IPL53_20680 [Ignavibacteria bacterium]|nr:hypothetical protein [Ignavibacteria bacterium]